MITLIDSGSLRNGVPGHYEDFSLIPDFLRLSFRPSKSLDGKRYAILFCNNFFLSPSAIEDLTPIGPLPLQTMKDLTASESFEFTREFGPLTLREPRVCFPASGLLESYGFVHLALDNSSTLSFTTFKDGFSFLAGDLSTRYSSLTSKSPINFNLPSHVTVSWSFVHPQSSLLTLRIRHFSFYYNKTDIPNKPSPLFANILIHPLYLDSLDRPAAKAEQTKPKSSRLVGEAVRKQVREMLGLGLGSGSGLKVSQWINQCGSEVYECIARGLSTRRTNLEETDNSTPTARTGKQQTEEIRKNKTEEKLNPCQLPIIDKEKRINFDAYSPRVRLSRSPSLLFHPVFYLRITSQDPGGKNLLYLFCHNILTMSPTPPVCFPRNRQQIAEQTFAPPSFQKFLCTMSHTTNKEKTTSKDDQGQDRNPDDADRTGDAFSSTKDSLDPKKQVPSKLTGQDQPKTDMNKNDWSAEDTNYEDLKQQSNIETTHITQKDVSFKKLSTSLPSRPRPSHVCTHKSHSATSFSVSRHGGPGTAGDVGVSSDDPLPSDDGVPTPETAPVDVGDEPGVIRDPENEGDREILKRKESGKSDLTADIDQLQPHYTSPDHGSSTPGRMETDTDAPKPDKKPETTIDKRDTNKNEDNASTKQVIDSEAEDEEQTRNREENERYERCMREHDEFYRLEDERLAQLSTPDTSGSYDPLSTNDEGGRAGLDPDHSSMWVPESIIAGANLSRSKKRRRRQKKKQERNKNQDSLGKLLEGKQTKEDEELISTYDFGNHAENKSNNHNISGVQGGNLLQKRRKITNCNKEDDFVATLNSTKYGADFDCDTVDSQSHSVLREGSEKEESIKEDVIDPDDGDEPELSNETLEDNIEIAEDKDDRNSSNNSTGTKRKRKRNKKAPIAGKQSKQDQKQQLPESTARETRSRTQGKQIPSDDTSKVKDKVLEDTKGEKEKGEKEKGEREKNPERAITQVSHDTQVEVFKQPSCSRSDIRRLVAKAVHKSKPKLSGNFAINTKIQYFKVVTDSSLVKKIPVIEESAPLIEMSIPEFIWPSHDKTIEEDNMINVKSKGVIQFIILVRSCHVPKESWDTPTIEKVRDFASFLTCQIAEHKLEFGTVLRWTNPWGNVAVMGLDSSDLGLLLKFRTFLSTLRYIHQFFNTFPKDAMTESLSISILLRSDLREFQEKYLAEALFARNDLSGVLETLQAETFTALDKTRAGVSKSGWRNVLLEGDDDFLKSLSKFTALHWFNIGPATVQIHGGERRAETEAEIEAKNRRKRFNMPIGQALTESAKSSINKSFRADQEALHRNLIVPANAQHQQSGANRAPMGKKKK